MRIEALKIKEFRNIKSISLIPCDKSNIIFGQNAQGKTNLIEAIWLFSGARSFRGSRDADHVMIGEKEARLELDFFAGERVQTASISIGENKKTVLLNEIKKERVSSLSGVMCAVVFSPDHLSLIKQGPENRRRFIDTSLCQAYPKYIKILEGYGRALKQRNALLKEIFARPQLMATLDAWDESLLDYGSYITHMRARYVKKLAPMTAAIYDGISSGKEIFSAAYKPGFNTEVPASREDIRREMEAALKADRASDIKNGITRSGPHRDDMEIMLDGISARTYGSQGQQRSCILALKLAECGILEERNGESPVILLDDVMSELDKSRRDFLLNRIGDRQIFITCCDAEVFKSLKNGRIFEIKQGQLKESP